MTEGADGFGTYTALIEERIETEIGAQHTTFVVNIRKIKMHMGTGRDWQHTRRTGMKKIKSPRISSLVTRTTREEKV